MRWTLARNSERAMAKKDHKNKHNKKNKGPFGGGPNPNSKLAKARDFERLLQRSEKLWEQGDPDAAIDILEELRERDPDDSRPVVLLAVMSMEMGETAEALNYLRLAVRLEPDDPRVLNILSTVLMMSNRPAQALETMRRSRTLDRSGQVFTVEDQSHLTQLEEALRQVAKEVNVPFQEFLKAQNLIEQSYDAGDQNNTEEALNLLGQACQLAPKWADPALTQAQLFYDTGEADKSIDALRLILDDIDPNSLTTLGRLILLLTWRGQSEEAVGLLPRLNDLFEKQVMVSAKQDSTPNLESSTVLYSLVASCFGINGDHQRAYDIMRQGEEAGIEYDSETLSVAGVAAYNLGKIEEAQKLWQRVEAEEAQDGRTFYDGLKFAVERPRPTDAPPLQLPYLTTSVFVPIPILSKVVVMKNTEEVDEYGEAKVEFDNEAMRANYEKLNPQYNLRKAFIQNMHFGVPINAETQIGLLSDIATPDLMEALKEYATGYLGAESARRYAVAVLKDNDYLPKEGTVRFWVEDEAQWQDLQLTDFASQEEFEAQMLNTILGQSFDLDDFEDEEEDDDEALQGV